jgi:hypothetical protein
MQLGHPTPDFSLLDLSGQIHRLNDYRGWIVILNFWSAECPHAARVDREMGTYLREWGERVALLTVAANANESEAQVAAAAPQRGLGPVLLGSRSGVPDEYEAQTTPHLFVVDADGILRYRGAFDDVTFRSARRRVPISRMPSRRCSSVEARSRRRQRPTAVPSCAMFPDSC